MSQSLERYVYVDIDPEWADKFIAHVITGCDRLNVEEETIHVIHWVTRGEAPSSYAARQHEEDQREALSYRYSDALMRRK